MIERRNVHMDRRRRSCSRYAYSLACLLMSFAYPGKHASVPHVDSFYNELCTLLIKAAAFCMFTDFLLPRCILCSSLLARDFRPSVHRSEYDIESY